MASMTASTDKDEAPRLTKWEWTRAARKQPKEALSPLARHTLQTLAEYADPNGSNCRPSYQSLGDDMGRSRSQAGEGVKELVERGWVERRAITVHGRRATLFVPLIPASAGVASSGPPDDGPAVETGASSGPPDGTCPAHRTQPDQDQIKNQEEEARAREVDSTVEVGPADVAEMIDTAVRLVADVEPGQARKVEQSPKVAEAARSAVCRGLLAADLVLAWQEQEITAFTSSGTATAVHVLRRLGSPLPARKATRGTGSAGCKTGWNRAPGTVADHGTESSKVLSGW